MIMNESVLQEFNKIMFQARWEEEAGDAHFSHGYYIQAERYYIRAIDGYKKAWELAEEYNDYAKRFEAYNKEVEAARKRNDVRNLGWGL